MKIIHCIGSLEGGGAEKQMQLLVNNSKPPFIIKILTGNNNTTTINDDIEIFEVKKNSKYDIFRLWVGLSKIIIKEKPDLVHCWIPDLIAIPCAFVGRFCGAKIITSRRGSTPFKVSPRQFIRQRALYISHFFSHKIITNFPIRNDTPFFNLLYKWKKGTVIRNAINLDKIENIVPSRLATDISKTNYFELISVGRLTKEKNPNILIESINLLLKKNIPVRLHLFGEGPMRESLKIMVQKLNIESHVIFHGYKKNWLSYAKNGNAIVHSSGAEGMSNVILEACAIRKPIITTNIPSISSMLEHNKHALLMKPQCAEDLSKGIIAIYKDGNLARKLTQNSYTFIKGFSISKMVDLFQKEYQKLYRQK